jgi:hypothetical protein
MRISLAHVQPISSFPPILFFFIVKCTSIRLIRLFVDRLPAAAQHSPSAGNDVTNT